MKELNLYRIWQIINTLVREEEKFHEQDKYIYFVGSRHNYVEYTFENFLNFYSFKVDKEYITVYNNEEVSWENFTYNNFIYLPKELTAMSDEQIKEWIKEKTEKEFKRLEENKIAEKEKIKAQIERLNKEYNRL